MDSNPTPPAAPPPELAAPAPRSPPSQMQSPNSAEDADNANHLTHNLNPDDTARIEFGQNRAMDNFRALVMRIAASDQSRPLTAVRKSLIEKRLGELFPDTRTPDHPAYAAMIHRAILELNDDWGSTEESISEFITNKYDNLPWAHSTFLKHHLWKLCESGEIIMICEKRYLLGNAITRLSPAQSTGTSSKREQLKTKRWKKRGRPRKKDVIKEEIQPKVEQIEMIDIAAQVTEEQNKVIEEHYWLKESQNELFDESSRPKEENGQIIVEKNQSKEWNEGNRERVQEELPNVVVEIEPQQQENGGNDEWNQQQKQGTGDTEEQKQPQEQNDATEGCTLLKKQQIEVVEEKIQLLQQQSGVITELEQQKPERRQLRIRFRLPKPEQTTLTTVASPCLNHQHEKQKEPDYSCMERPSEILLNVAATIEESSTAGQQNKNEQQQPVRQGRGRPRKLNPEAAAATGLLLQSTNQYNPPQQMLGRPNCQGLGRPPKYKSLAGRNVENSPNKQQPKGRGRGRPQKLHSGIQGQ